MIVKRPRIEGYAVISREGMIATADGRFPDAIKIPADHQFYQDSVDRASAVANGRHSAEGGEKERLRHRLVLTRRVDRLVPDPHNPKVILWNPAAAPFEEAWARLGIENGTLAVVGGTDVFELFLGERPAKAVAAGPSGPCGRHGHPYSLGMPFRAASGESADGSWCVAHVAILPGGTLLGAQRGGSKLANSLPRPLALPFPFARSMPEGRARGK